MLDLPADGKPWKQKKLLLSEFEDAVGVIDASVGADCLLEGNGDMGKLTEMNRFVMEA